MGRNGGDEVYPKEIRVMMAGLGDAERLYGARTIKVAIAFKGELRRAGVDTSPIARYALVDEEHDRLRAAVIDWARECQDMLPKGGTISDRLRALEECEAKKEKVE